MVSRQAWDVNGGRCVVVTVVFDDCRIVTVGANVKGSVFVWRRRCVNFLGGFKMVMGLLSIVAATTGRVGRTIGNGGRIGADLLSRRVQRD